MIRTYADLTPAQREAIVSDPKYMKLLEENYEKAIRWFERKVDEMLRASR